MRCNPHEYWRRAFLYIHTYLFLFIYKGECASLCCGLVFSQIPDHTFAQKGKSVFLGFSARYLLAIERKPAWLLALSRSPTPLHICDVDPLAHPAL